VLGRHSPSIEFQTNFLMNVFNVKGLLRKFKSEKSGKLIYSMEIVLAIFCSFS
jgi:hypothetical protein